MSATVDFGYTRAEIRDEDGRWHCEDQQFEEVLNTVLLDPDGASGADPNPALTLAWRAKELFGGQIVKWDVTERDEIEAPG